jgi:hypothetical protein
MAKSAAERKAEVEAFLEHISGTYLDDVHEARRRLDASSLQFDRRAYIRAVSASVEGLIFEFKQVALVAHEAGVVTLAPEEVAILREETYDLAENGRPVIRKKLSSLLPTLRFVIPLFGRTLGVQYEPAVDGAGWQAFRQAVEIRNRVTHPRSLEDGQVSEADLEVVHQANQWYEDVLKGLFEAFRRKKGQT